MNYLIPYNQYIYGIKYHTEVMRTMYDDMMYEEKFPLRLAQLRNAKGVSAREMSLSIGQNAGYINLIENGKAFPSLQGFFYICEYLNITPQEFFDTETKAPDKLRDILEDMKKLNDAQLEHIAAIVKDLIK